MAFMIPVVKNDYNIYASCPSSRAGSGTPQQSRGSSASSSPAAASFLSSPRHSHTPAYNKAAKSSEMSQHKFHSKVVDKLKKVFRVKDQSGSTDAVNHPSSSLVTIR